MRNWSRTHLVHLFLFSIPLARFQEQKVSVTDDFECRWRRQGGRLRWKDRILVCKYMRVVELLRKIVGVKSIKNIDQGCYLGASTCIG